MKKLTAIAAAIISAMLICFSVSAATNTEQYVTVEDGQTVVYIINYVEPDEFSSKQTISWYDANGTKFVSIYMPLKESDISAKVSWTDAAGNRYVNNGTIVTVFDADGNLIAVLPANK